MNELVNATIKFVIAQLEVGPEFLLPIFRSMYGEYLLMKICDLKQFKIP
jgi:hypothetical protein